MSILADDLILASDVTEYEYNEDTRSEVHFIAPSLFESDHKHRTYIMYLPPGHIINNTWGTWDESGSGQYIETSVSVMNYEDYDADDDDLNTWTVLIDETKTKLEYLIENTSRDIKVVKYYVHGYCPAGVFNAGEYQLITHHKITSDIAVAGNPIRVLNSTLTEWLDAKSTPVTTDLYYDGRVGYYIEDDDTTDYADRYLWSGAVQDLKTLESALEVLDTAYETDPSDENLALITAKQAEIDAQEIVVQGYVDAIELAEEE